MQMLALESAWGDLPHTWVTLRAADTTSLLAPEDTVFAYGPNARSIKNILRNVLLASRVLHRQRPDVMLSTGGGITVPFFLVGKLFGARLVFVDSVTRIRGASLTGRLVYPLCDRFFVQWPEAATLRRMEFSGNLL